MAAHSLTAEDICRNLSYLKSRIAENMHALQGLLFISCDMFELLHDMEAVDDDFTLMKRWAELASKLQEV